jgi:RNA polymerase sigma factor (sigma-70 family)
VSEIQHPPAVSVSPEVLEQKFPRIVEKWRRIAGKRQYPEHLVDDAIGEAGLKLVQKLHLLRDPLRLEAFANAIFINCIYDLIALRHGDDSLDEQRDDVRPDGRPTPEGELLDREARERERERLQIMRDLVEALTKRQQEVLRLHFDGLNCPQIARVVGLDDDRVRHVLTEIRQTLRALVAERPAGEGGRGHWTEKP